MSNWDHYIFGTEAAIDFFAELEDLDAEDLVEAVQDAIKSALHDSDLGEADQHTALAAATLVAIWSGAPFSAAAFAEEYFFIREFIGEVDEDLVEAASEMLEEELSRLDEEAPDGLDTFAEALS